MSSFIEINKFNVVSDSSFHLTRANEIYQNLKQGVYLLLSQLILLTILEWPIFYFTRRYFYIR